MLEAVVPKAVVYLVIAAAVAFALWFAQNIGYQRGRALLTEYVAEEAVKTVNLQKRLVEVVTEVQVKYVDRIKVVKEKGDTIIKEVPVYVDKSDDSACELRRGFLRITDAAAKGEPPGPATSADREAGGVALSAATETIAANYQTCLKWREQVIGWQEFWARVKAEIEKDQ